MPRKSVLSGLEKYLAKNPGLSRDDIAEHFGAPLCDHYRSESHTCTHGGGNYCGKWRQYESKINKTVHRKSPTLFLYSIIAILPWIFVFWLLLVRLEPIQALTNPVLYTLFIARLGFPWVYSGRSFIYAKIGKYEVAP